MISYCDRRMSEKMQGEDRESSYKSLVAKSVYIQFMLYHYINEAENVDAIIPVSTNEFIEAKLKLC